MHWVAKARQKLFYHWQTKFIRQFVQCAQNTINNSICRLFLSLYKRIWICGYKYVKFASNIPPKFRTVCGKSFPETISVISDIFHSFTE